AGRRAARPRSAAARGSARGSAPARRSSRASARGGWPRSRTGPRTGRSRFRTRAAGRPASRRRTRGSGDPSRSSWGVTPIGGAGEARRAARIRSDRNGAPAPRLRVEGEERVRVGGGLAGEQADRLGGLQRARERGDRPEHAGLLARRHVARRRRLLEDAAVARAPPGEHGEELRAEAEHAGVPSPAAASAVAAGAPRPPTPITRTRPRAIFSSIVDMGNKKAPLQSGRGAHQRANPYLSPPAKAASELAPASLSGPVAVASPGLALSHSG